MDGFASFCFCQKKREMISSCTYTGVSPQYRVYLKKRAEDDVKKDISGTIKRADRFRVILVGEGILVGAVAGVTVILYLSLIHIFQREGRIVQCLYITVRFLL